MTQMVKLYYRNILENSTISVTSENASFPKYRLYDREIGKLFKGNSTPPNFYITADQGAVVSYPVNTLIIPAGHNLDGLTVKVQYSTDNFSADINDAVTWVQSGSGQICKSFTQQTKRYWRLNIASPASPPELTEMFLTKNYTFVRNPSFGFEERMKRNMYRGETVSGLARFTKNGELRKVRDYALRNIDATQKGEFESWESLCEGMKSFYIEDVSGNLFFAESLEEFAFQMQDEGHWNGRLYLQEILP